MSKLDIINSANKKVGEIDLSEALKEKVNKAVLYQAVKTYLSSKHHGTVDTKTRAEVLFTTKKVYRQKGTGNARHGSMKSSPFVGGGRVFGPHPRDYTLGMNKKVRRLAVREALKARLIDGSVMVVEKIPLTQIKTSTAVKFMDGLGLKGGLVVLEAADDVIEKSVRNIRDFKLVRADTVNVFDLLKYPKILFTAGAFSKVAEKYLA
ncbi:MAG: 50S ribosomal protein L4 [Deltaproteobacteria bacterium]|nr:50S ribosomal protein L4 [Deltaproteobacteria bacterium]